MELELAPKRASNPDIAVLGLIEIEPEAMRITHADNLHRQGTEAEVHVGIEREKSIDPLHMKVPAGVRARLGLDPLTLGGLPARKSYWKGYRWIWLKTKFATTSPSQNFRCLSIGNPRP